MDFNNLGYRLKRLTNALNKRLDFNIESNVKPFKSSDRYTINYKQFDQSEVDNRIINAIHAIANLEDNLRDSLKNINKDPGPVNNMINESESLKLILDLSNSDKHSYPSRSSKTGKNPKIANTSQRLVFVGSPNSALKFSSSGDLVNLDQIGGKFAIKIIGDVVDENGCFIMAIENMFDEAISTIEKFIKEHKLIRE